ncbi:cilia- and flagella-associated protein 43-like isoform X2 [Littorina saxatilis]|uniref:Cilia- and flagella-associated protein 43 n=1 Tax=Littorina saxatilis TaxID=31220 RepID=A0AAN9GJF5_9CAEN
MDQFGSLDLAWTQGYDGQELFYIDNDVVCYQCGRNVKILHDNGQQTVFAFRGNGVGPFAAHKINKKFAIAERCIKPKIFIYRYPFMAEHVVLEGGAKIEFQQLVFSASDYLLSLSALPEFEMVLWDYEKGHKMTSVTISPEAPTSISFNPANWRQICVTTQTSLTVWNIEQSNTKYILLPQEVKLPPEDKIMYEEDEKDQGVSTRCSTRMSRYTIKVPRTAIAGLIGDMADRLNEIQDETVRVSPVAHAWTPTGDIFVSGDKGHLLKVDGESYKAQPLYYPSIEDPSLFRPFSGMSRRDTDIPAREEDDEAVPGRGSLDCLGLHRLGLFAAGKDGILRLFDIRGEELRIISSHNLDTPVTSITFSYDYSSLALGSPQGSIMTMAMNDVRSLQVLADVHFGEYIGIGVLAASANVCVSARSDGMMQAWSIDKGLLLSSLALGEPASCLACSPLAHFAVVGSVGGQVFFVDFTNVDRPRIVQRVRFYDGAVKTLVFDQDGMYLVVGGDDKNVFVIDGRPSSNFVCLGFTDVGGEVKSISAVTKSTMVRVAVAVYSGNHKKNTADRIVRFDITENLIKDLKDNYGSIKQDFKCEAINKVTFFLLHPSLGIALGEGAVAYTIGYATRNIQTLVFPTEIPTKKDAPELYLSPESSFTGHQLLGGEVLLSSHLKWLASYAPDGILMLRTIGSMDRTVSICAHDYRAGGIRCMAFSHDCQSVFTTGYDGVICCYKWNLLTGGGLTSKAKSGVESSRSRKTLTSEMTVLQDDVLQGMDVWQPPEPMSRPPSALDKERKERAEEMKKQALEREEIYRTPTPEPYANCTWLEEKEFEALREEEKQYADTKRGLREQIRDIRKTIQAMMQNNEELPDIEKLGRHEFDLDIDEQSRLQAEGEAEVERVREEIEFDNLAKRYLREMIKRECWDNMQVKGRSIQAFNSILEVANFPLKERAREILNKLSVVTARRKVEMRELEIRKKEVDLVAKPSNSGEEDMGEGDDDDNFNKEQPSITGSLGAQYGGDSELFYSQFELHLRHQKINQIVLLEDAIHRIKVTFNKEFDEVFLRKEQEIAKIKEKNKRISKILSDLDLNEKMIEPVMSVYEKPERLLTVEDSEVKVEKYLTEAQLKKMEEQQKAEEDRRQREKGDNQRERALDMMMGGVLEIRKEDELKKDVPIPLFMQQKEEADWSEDEHKLVKEYERKVKELNEEREKFRKQLEAELRKLQGVITDSMAAFDDVLNQLFLKKIKVMMVIYQEELKILRLRCSLLMEEELETRDRELTIRLEHKKQLKQLASEAVSESRGNLEDFRNEYDILVAEDKVMDKAFKREFHDVSAVMADQLYRLFRKRPRGQKFKGAETPLLDGKNPNPFAERPSTARQNAQSKAAVTAALDDMDKPNNMPDGLDPSVWHRMCQYRRTKMESENLVKQKALMLAEMQAFLHKRSEEEEALRNEIEDITTQYNQLKEDQLRFSLNLEVQLLLKQGQVEVDAGQFVHDYRDSVLVQRSVVEELNNTIKQLGESKIASMVESKDFRKGIIQLEWEHKKMSMQMEDLENKMKDIQFMKVTREIQAYLNEGDYEAKKQQEIITLEQTILLQKKHHEKNVAAKKRIMTELRNSMKQREGNNHILDKDLEELNVAVNERRHIDEVNADRRMDTGAERRYQEIVQRRKLVDLAKAQAQEVAVLRAEVERLRMRTFPALVQVEH